MPTEEAAEASGKSRYSIMSDDDDDATFDAEFSDSVTSMALGECDHRLIPWKLSKSTHGWLGKNDEFYSSRLFLQPFAEASIFASAQGNRRECSLVLYQQ